MSLPPLAYHYFRLPLPYTRTLALQEQLHSLQLLQRRATPSTHKDVLLLLQHRPVYTAGRRQTDDELHSERTRLTRLGADFVSTQRGGQLTYHGPGQIVGYPLLDLARGESVLGIREYICKLQKVLEGQLVEAHGLKLIPSEHTGVFLDAQTKIASIGVQVRHRLTSHGFAMNITPEPLAWFNKIVACGLEDVKAGCIGKDATVEGEIPELVKRFGKMFGREMVKLDVEAEGEVEEAIRAVEEDARQAGDWHRTPLP
ncbi:hypothetical protein JAAARDRAFT_134512 [Jaapia argillacea MUCL 33604]|uniref:lipoyl(octanoyl) transferase n=1 Tax=Jaapia argillacea MUCL 33604 TaxID=933084 RepID=A0A067PLW8_9AGAM|nr:hypothetical protein JAAARDRAFT_134512 [Jaapia argillacea MUCL 33604]